MLSHTACGYTLKCCAGLGYSDLSCFGSEIRTPHIDSLASHGTRFTDFHTAAVNSPSHATLLTGIDHHATGLGQTVQTLMDSSAHRGKAGHEGYLTDQVPLLPEVLRREAGYYTAMAGKWNLGVELEHCPDKRGFDRSFALLSDAANHFAWEPDVAPNDDAKLPRFAQINVSALHAENGRYVDNAYLPAEFYSSDYYADKLLDYLDQRPTDKPFFAHLSFSAPHWPLQAPVNEVRQYYGVYDDGPKSLREQRLDALKKLNLVPPDTKTHAMIAPEITKWGSLTAEQRAVSSRRMETYAAMVSRLDYNVGRLISWLKYQKFYNNTQIILLASNGPAGASPNLDPKTGPEVQRYLTKYYNNTLGNIGNPTSFAWYGARWAQTSSPFRLYEGYPTEGATRVSCILKNATNLAFKRALCHSYCSIQDIAPTVAEQAGIQWPPGTSDRTEVSRFLHGRSWLPYLRGLAPFPHPAEQPFGMELNGQAALRKGSWKISFLNRPHGSEEWELFNLSDDLGETNNLARKRPDKLEELVKDFVRYREAVGVVGLTPQLRGLQGEMTDPSTWVKFETSRSVAQREYARRQRRKGSGVLFDAAGAESEDEFQDLDDDAVEML